MRELDAGLLQTESSESSLSDLARVERSRLTVAVAVVRYAALVPRRDGIAAGSHELALDKKRCRRVGHALDKSLAAWGGAVRHVLVMDEIRSHGAQLSWELWWAQHRLHLHNRIAYIHDEYAYDPPGRNRAELKLVNELNWVKHALR